MSELNELIATNASHAYHAGELHERDRILKLLEDIAIETKAGEIAVMELLSAITDLIKGEQK